MKIFIHHILVAIQLTETKLYISDNTFFYTVSQKNIPYVFDCNLKTNYQVLIIFGSNIPDKTCHQTTI